MSNTNSLPSILLTLIILFTQPATSQEMALAPPGISAQGLVTRDVFDYTALEQALISSVQTNTTEILLLADDFEAWSDSSEDWQSKAEWLNAAKAQTNEFIRNVSVRDVDDFSVVSFLLETTKTQHKKKTTLFIVDIWRKSTQKLTVRYSSNIATPKLLSNAKVLDRQY